MYIKKLDWVKKSTLIYVCKRSENRELLRYRVFYFPLAPAYVIPTNKIFIKTNLTCGKVFLLCDIFPSINLMQKKNTHFFFQ